MLMTYCDLTDNVVFYYLPSVSLLVIIYPSWRPDSNFIKSNMKALFYYVITTGSCTWAWSVDKVSISECVHMSLYNMAITCKGHGHA